MKPGPVLDKIRKLQRAGIAPRGTIRYLPEWVECCRMLIAEDGTWLLVEAGTQVEKHMPGQFVIDLPAARYMVEIFDIASRKWISRESAAGGPLVAGLPCTGNTLAIRIRESRSS
jgi:hypothetical protein